MKSISNRIKKTMKEKSLTAAELANLVGITPRAMQRKLQMDNYSVPDLEAIERVLGIEIFVRETTDNDAQVEEPTEEYKRKETSGINFHFHLSNTGEGSKALVEKMNEALAEFLKQEKDNQ